MSEHFNQIGQALAAGRNPDRQIRTNAEEYLKYAETEVSQFFSMLQQIYLDSSLDQDVRIAAAILFKNGIDKYWRKAATNAIPEQEKQDIRQRLFLSSTCPSAIRRQVSTAAAKIARLDFPSSWPNLFDQLLQCISDSQADDNILLAHTETLYLIVKTMASSRIATSRSHFQQISPTMMQYTLACYTRYSHQWLTGDHPTLESVKIADVALKTARRVVCYGFESPHHNDLCQEFFRLLSSQIKTMWTVMMQRRSQTDFEDDLLHEMYKNLLHAGKFFLELSSNAMENYSINHSFVLMPGSIEVVGTYWELALGLANAEDDVLRKVVIQGLILLDQCVKLSATSEKHLRLMSEADRTSITRSIQILRQDFFSRTALSGILEGLIMKFLVLSQPDLENWTEDPELWLLSQDASNWQLDVRPCAEKVLLDLFAHYKDDLSPMLMNVLASTADHLNGNDLLIKEAMYNALGVAAPHLFETFDFDNFLDRLVEEITIPDIPPLFRRRVVTLVAQWSSVKCSPARRPLVYHVVGNVLQDIDTEGRFGAALNAAFEVARLIDAWEWESEPFAPFASGYIECLVKILARANDIEAKMKVLTPIGMIYERIDIQTPTRFDLVLDQIPQEWEIEGGEYLLRVALLGLLSRLALTQRLNSPQGYAVVMPLISYSTDPDSFGFVYLVEEALEMWHAILQHATVPDENLLQLIPVLGKPAMLPSASETLAKILAITESYFLLFKQESASLALLQGLVQQMVSMLPTLAAKPLAHFAKVIESGVQNLGMGCMSDNDLWLLTELLVRDLEQPVMTVSILCLLCQIVISDLPRIARLWQASPQGDVTSRVVKVMLDKFDNLGQAKRRKSCAMALTALVTTGHPLFKDENVLAGLGNIWSDVLAEVQANAGNDLVYWIDDSILLEDIIPDSAEAQRRKDLMEIDPVCTTALRPFIRSGSQYVDTQLLGVNLESFMS